MCHIRLLQMLPVNHTYVIYDYSFWSYSSESVIYVIYDENIIYLIQHVDTSPSHSDSSLVSGIPRKYRFFLKYLSDS